MSENGGWGWSWSTWAGMPFRRNRSGRRFPGEPWKERRDWRVGRVRCEGKSRMLVALLFAFLWNLVAWPVVVVHAPAGLAARDPKLLLLFLFPLVGICLALWAGYAILRYARFGAAVFEMEDIPGIIGQGIRGTVRARMRLEPTTKIHTKLVCIHRYVSGSNRNRSVHEKILWEEERRLTAFDVASGGGQVFLPVAFAIPSDARQTDHSDPDDRILWRLQVSAALPGIDYASAFEVPVFRTARSEFPPEDGEFADLHREQESVEGYEQPAGSRIRVRDDGTTVEVYLPPFRNVPVVLGLGVFTLIWSGVLAFLLTQRGWSMVLFQVIWGVFELILVVLLARLMLLSRQVIAGPHEVSVRTRFLGWPFSRVVPAEMLRAVQIRIGLQGGTTPFYDIQLVRNDGTKVLAARSIRDKREARWVAHMIRRAAGLSDQA